VEAEPTNVGLNGPSMDVLTLLFLDACASLRCVLALLAVAPPEAATSAIKDTNERTAIDVRITLLFKSFSLLTVCRESWALCLESGRRVPFLFDRTDCRPPDCLHPIPPGYTSI
jgi:hypothetical protein